MDWINKGESAAGGLAGIPAAAENALNKARISQRQIGDDFIPSNRAATDEIQPTIFNYLREQHAMLTTLRERLRTLRNKVGASAHRGESPDPSKLDGMPIHALAGTNSNVLRECHDCIENIDSCLGG